MAVLSRDEYFNRIRERVGNDSSDESISFLEDMTDTYNSLENASRGDGVDWEQKAHEIDEAWKKRYASRFFNGAVQPNSIPDEKEEEQGYDPEKITINSLFEEDKNNGKCS